MISSQLGRGGTTTQRLSVKRKKGQEWSESKRNDPQSKKESPIISHVGFVLPLE